MFLGGGGCLSNLLPYTDHPEHLHFEVTTKIKVFNWKNL